MTSRPLRQHRLVRLTVALGLGVAVLSCGGGSSSPSSPQPAPTATPTPAPAGPVVAVAGDISCGPGNTPSVGTCRQFDTSELIVAMNPSLVIAAGDIQYDDGRYEDYLRHYDVTWGRFKPITRPALGNHEYYAYSDARGYFDYFNGVGVADGPAGLRGRGFYSFNLGGWHVVVLNSNCERVGGCGVDSTQWRWLRDDLQASTATCTLAVQHYPRFSSGPNGSTASMQPFWQLLVERGVDLVVSGHDHLYERFAPMNASGAADSARGLRQFVVGTGGYSHYVFRTPLATSEARIQDTFGVLKLTLNTSAYEWEFLPIAYQSGRDAGSQTCH
jgi:hypothetical protein